MGGAASRGLKAAPAVARRAPPAPVAAPPAEPQVAAASSRAPAAGAAVASSAPAFATDSGQAKDEPLESMMLRLGDAIKGHVVAGAGAQPRPPGARIPIARRKDERDAVGRLRAEDVREAFRRHRDEKLSAEQLAAHYRVDATVLAKALHAARLPRIKEVDGRLLAADD